MALAVHCKARSCYESQSRHLKNEGIAATHTAFASGCTTQKILPTGLYKLRTSVTTYFFTGTQIDLCYHVRELPPCHSWGRPRPRPMNNYLQRTFVEKEDPMYTTHRTDWELFYVFIAIM